MEVLIFLLLVVVTFAAPLDPAHGTVISLPLCAVSNSRSLESNVTQAQAAQPTSSSTQTTSSGTGEGFRVFPPLQTFISTTSTYGPGFTSANATIPINTVYSNLWAIPPSTVPFYGGLDPGLAKPRSTPSTSPTSSSLFTTSPATFSLLGSPEPVQVATDYIIVTIVVSEQPVITASVILGTSSSINEPSTFIEATSSSPTPLPASTVISDIPPDETSSSDSLSVSMEVVPQISSSQSVIVPQTKRLHHLHSLHQLAFRWIY